MSMRVGQSDAGRLNPVTLRFPGPVEEEFQQYYFQTSVRQMRVALLLGVAIFALFGVLDIIAIPEQKEAVWRLRYFLVCPYVLAIVALSYTKAFRRVHQLAIGSTAALAGVIVVVITTMIDPPVTYIYSTGSILVMFYGFTFMRLRFNPGLLLALVLVAAYNIFAYIDKVPSFALATTNFFLFTSIVLGGTASYSIELFIRRNYRQRRLIEANAEELTRKYEELERFNQELRESKQAVVESSRRAQLIFSALADALPGTILEDKYQLEEKIGSGAFGTVYSGRHLLLDAPVAVKIFRPVPGKNMDKSLERFRREGMSAKRISHPNAVTVLDFGISAEAIAFLVMELLKGRTLADELRNLKKVTARRAAEVALPICSVLAEAHRANIIHRDIKPSNIFLHQSTAGEIVKVVDFGIAKMLDTATDAEDTHLTATGALIGTPSYMAPERMGTDAYGTESDVYSVGILMYEMITGSLPFEGAGQNLLRAAYLHATAEIPAPRLKERDIPEELDTLIVRAMATDPAERPSAQEMAETIAHVFALEMPTVQPGANVATAVSVDAETVEREMPPPDVHERETEEM
jgi:tRNA A-37 threonylcarbamoyl transferase component Bud32